MPRLSRILVLCASGTAVLAGCIDRESAQKAIESLQGSGTRPDEMPMMLNREPPFRYPSSLWESRVQGNVTLRIYIDTTGRVRPESTSVEESSGYAAFDSAAVMGTTQLRFAPAKLRGQLFGVSILLPVFFRHPSLAPLPGDTILRSLRPTNP